MIKDFVIEEENLSLAWSKAFLQLMEPGIDEIQPLIINITGFQNNIPNEDKEIRKALDDNLLKNGMALCHTVANTIFPISLWNPQKPRHSLYDRYEAILPRLRKCKGNSYGLYFERLILFGSQKHKVNQLEFIIANYKKGMRRSAFQACILDPYRDHTAQARRGFPCLQQVALAPMGDDGFSIIGIYPTQHIFERAYGNYLGLCRVGHFLANGIGLHLKQMKCITSFAKLGVNKQDVRALEKVIKSLINK